MTLSKNPLNSRVLPLPRPSGYEPDENDSGTAVILGFEWCFLTNDSNIWKCDLPEILPLSTEIQPDSRSGLALTRTNFIILRSLQRSLSMDQWSINL